MPSRRNSFLNDLARAPWPVGIVAGLFLFLLLRHGLPAWIAAKGGPFAQTLAQGAGGFGLLAWMMLAACWIAALASYLDARRKRRLLETRTDLDSLAALGWQDFERLVGEAFRREGYAVEETGLGGRDGGIDLVLRRDGKRTLVQCKQWKRERVPVNVVREMYGLLAHHAADAVVIAALGGYTTDAARFATGKPIRLIDGPTLLAMIRAVQPKAGAGAGASIRKEPTLPAPGSHAPGCPRCGAVMVRRTNSKNGNAFWACPGFPKCRETR